MDRAHNLLSLQRRGQGCDARNVVIAVGFEPCAVILRYEMGVEDFVVLFVNIAGDADRVLPGAAPVLRGWTHTEPC